MNIAHSAMKKSTIYNTPAPPLLNGEWDLPCWNSAETLMIDQFRVESSNHHPITEVKTLYCPDGLHLIFRVQDQFVRSIQTTLNSPVCNDSCVEFFVQPQEDKGYFNFEVNCGGTLLASYIENCTRTETGFSKFSLLSQSTANRIGIFHSMPSVVDPEIEEPTTWINQLFIPFDVLAEYVGELGALPGQVWRANFYKCGGETSHPHWAAWAPVPKLNFHDPASFGKLQFETLTHSQ